MGYRVDYQPIKKVRGAEKRTVSVSALTGLCFLLFVIIVNSTWPRGADILRGVIFQGNAAVTAAALEDLTAELTAGEELFSAVEAFCHKVIQEAEFDPS